MGWPLLTLIGHWSRFKTLTCDLEHPCRTQAWVLHGCSTGGGVPVQPRARGSILSSAGRLRAPPSLSYSQPPSHPVDQPTDHPTDQPPAPEPHRAPDKHPVSTQEPPTTPPRHQTPAHALISADPLRSAPIRSDPIRSGAENLPPGFEFCQD
ncbi:hypothetical protein PGT21_033925 [Puccinia graminis f. sp. tritici]|uniref:Uncharacterized protein n=1 Tax=Puccinia graminis f. sp. tritici TaxID=56615 RepID=A0A5B0MX23_PUCGR|nr:hypothetical protein PGT21_033925 [Puccinia graminis f. sp. tritici]